MGDNKIKITITKDAFPLKSGIKEKDNSNNLGTSTNGETKTVKKKKKKNQSNNNNNNNNQTDNNSSNNQNSKSNTAAKNDTDDRSTTNNNNSNTKGNKDNKRSKEGGKKYIDLSSENNFPSLLGGEITSNANNSDSSPASTATNANVYRDLFKDNNKNNVNIHEIQLSDNQQTKAENSTRSTKEGVQKEGKRKGESGVNGLTEKESSNRVHKNKNNNNKNND